MSASIDRLCATRCRVCINWDLDVGSLGDAGETRWPEGFSSTANCVANPSFLRNRLQVDSAALRSDHLHLSTHAPAEADVCRHRWVDYEAVLGSSLSLHQLLSLVSAGPGGWTGAVVRFGFRRQSILSQPTTGSPLNWASWRGWNRGSTGRNWLMTMRNSRPTGRMCRRCHLRDPWECDDAIPSEKDIDICGAPRFSEVNCVHRFNRGNAIFEIQRQGSAGRRIRPDRAMHTPCA